MLPLVLVVVFLLGCAVGGFLSFCAARLPYEKSLLWPGPRCEKCCQPLPRYAFVPLVGYWLAGRCRACGTPFSWRQPLVEIATGLAFVGVFYLEVVRNVADVPALREAHRAILAGDVPAWAWAYFAARAVLLSLLILVTITDLEHLEIPLPITVTGTLLGLVVSVLCPWPWPGTGGIPQPTVEDPLPLLPSGLYPWPVWHELPGWMGPGSWTLGLATGLAGAAAGTLVLRGVRFLFGLGRGIEGLGLGDADLMMMAGAFVGWQAVLVAFFVAVMPALVLGLAQLLIRGDRPMPFGPPLCAGTLLTLWLWPVLGERMQPLLFNAELLGTLAVFGAVFLLGAAFLLRLIRGKPETQP